MARALLLVVAAFAAQSALAIFGIETDPDKIHAQWKKEKLEALGSHREAKERAAAADWLGGRDDPESIAALAKALSDPDSGVRTSAANALWKSGKAAAPARPQLQDALNDADVHVVARAAGALQMIGMKEAELVAPRKRVFNAPDVSIEARFLVSRNLIGEEPAPRLLVAMLAYLDRYAPSKSDAGRANTELAQQALVRLAKSQDRSIVAPLMDATRNSKAGQVALLTALKEIKPAPEGYTELTVALLDSPDPKVRYAALGAMRSLNRQKDVEQWAPRAAAMLADPESSVRNEALWALKSSGGLAAGEIDKVVAALRDPNDGVRRSAASAIGEMGDAKQAVPAALKARVAEAGRPALLAVVDSDPDSEVRSEAKSALAKLGAGGGARMAAASESSGMTLLRDRKVSFEPSSFFRVLSEGDVALVQAFLDAGMSPKEPLMDMGPPLRVMLFSHQACSPQERPTRAGTKQLVKLLLERGADPNGSDARGNSPLMEAASHGCDREVMRLLIKAGANVNAKNASGLTPFESGLFWGHDGLEEIIAAGYRLPPDKVKAYEQGYAGKPAVQAMIKKAARK